MRKQIVFLLFLICTILPVGILAQTNDVITSCPSYVVPLKHDKRDSVYHTRPVFTYSRKQHNNRHIKNPAVRYSIDNLKKKNKDEYKELNQAINTLMEYAENPHLKYMLDYVKGYFATVGTKEEAINTIKNRINRDSLEYSLPVQDRDSVEYNILMNQDLITLLSFMEQDNNYQWLREKSRDSVRLTVQSASGNSKSIWLNTGKHNHYRFTAENLVGDTIDTWIQVLPEGNVIKFHLSENVFQTKGTYARELEETHLLPHPEKTTYNELIPIDRGSIRRNYWTYYTDITLSFGQGYISKNWSGGGENSLSLLSDLKYFINYKKNSLSWENSFRYRLGALKSGSEKLSKNEDKLEILSKLSHKAFKLWNYAAQFDMNTVLFKSYNYPKREVIVANFLSPAYFTLSVGFDYKPNSNMSLYFSPIAGKWTIVRDTANVNPTRYGIEKGKKSKSAAGAKIDFNNKHKLFDFISLDHRLVVFASYYDEPVTVDWRLGLGFNINYFMKTSINMNAIYDRNNSKKIQFKETLSLDVYFRF